MKKYKFILYFILYFCFSICINIVHPVTPTYVNSLNLPEYYFGFFFALMSLGQVIGAIFFGFLSDKIGRKWLISIGIVGYALSQAGFGFINTYPGLILVFRIFSGFFVSAPNTLFISMALDYSNKDNSVKNLSILSFSSVLGQACGYEIGGSLYNYLSFTIQQVFIIQIAVGCITAFIFALLMKDKKNENVSSKSKFSFKSLKNLNGLVYLLLVSLFVLTVGQVLVNKYLDPYVTDIGFEPAILGHYIFITGVIGAISNLLIIPLIKKVKNKKLAVLLVSFIFTSAALTFLTFLLPVNILYLLFTTHLIYIILKALILPLEQNEIASYSDGNNYGQLMGARQTVLSIGNVIGPFIGSAIYTKGSPIIFVVAASIIFLSLGLYVTYFGVKHNRNKDNINTTDEQKI